MTTPAWQAATTGQPPKAAHINQLLGTHTITNLYAGTLQSAQTTAGSAPTSTSGLYIAQRFTTGSSQTAVGYVTIALTTTTASGSLLPPTTVSLCPDNSGAPGATPIVSTTVTAEYANAASGGTPTAVLTYPLPATGLSTSTQYWIVVAAASGAGTSYTWYQSTQTSGASTSSNGTAWAAQTYGLVYAVYDQSAIPPLASTWEDGGARWSASTYSSTKELQAIAEYTAGQTSSGYLQSYRTLTYTSGLLTGVA